MRFGPVGIGDAVGAVLAHSVATGSLRLKKGRVLDPGDIAGLKEAGIKSVTVARPEAGDMGEDDAALAIGRALVPDPEDTGISVSPAFAGRVNLFAGHAGLLRFDRERITAFNSIDPAITLATLPEHARVREKQMIATVKIIPYAVPAARVDEALELARDLLTLAPYLAGTAGLIMTRTDGFRPALLEKGAVVVRRRLDGLGWKLGEPVICGHEVAEVANAISRTQGDMLLILGASATSDASDICPAALKEAGGRLLRFGMPVDPGNLLFLGEFQGRPVVGLPGCARSPALNGADWVLERLAAGIVVTGHDIIDMGAGGLLKEIPLRPQPRSAPRPETERRKVAALILAAGSSRRMRGKDKLLETLAGGEPLLRQVALAALGSRADSVLVLLRPSDTDRRAALAGLGLEIVEVPDHSEGMAASLRAGVQSVRESAAAAVVLLADMPDVRAEDIDRLIASWNPHEGREVCRAVSGEGQAGHPVLFGSRFFESLIELQGDVGARSIVKAAGDLVAEVTLAEPSSFCDLDTPEDWAAYRKGRVP